MSGSPPAGMGNVRLRSARQARGLRSQQALADAVNRTAQSLGLRLAVTPRTVRRWESDTPPWPNPDHQSALEALFGSSLAELGFSPPWSDSEHPAASDVAATHAVGAPPRRILSAYPSRQTRTGLPRDAIDDYVTVTTAHRRLYWFVAGSQISADWLCAGVEVDQSLCSV